jgi:hypothetical protein
MIMKVSFTATHRVVSVVVVSQALIPGLRIRIGSQLRVGASVLNCTRPQNTPASMGPGATGMFAQ